jgi:hypothetical protein
MDGNEKALELLKRAEDLGLGIEFDSGFLAVELTETGDPAEQRVILADLGKWLTYVRELAKGRALAARAKKYVGQRIWHTEYGYGVLAGVAREGQLTITTERTDFRGPLTLTANVESLLIIAVDEGADGASSTQSDKPAAEPARKSFLDRLRRNPRED